MCLPLNRALAFCREFRGPFRIIEKLFSRALIFCVATEKLAVQRRILFTKGREQCHSPQLRGLWIIGGFF